MRFIGCKKNLLPFLDSVLHERGIQGGVFCDLFAGTSTVGRHYKKAGFGVMSTDLLYFSFVLQKSRLEINAPPEFAGLMPRLKTANGGGLFGDNPPAAAIRFLNQLEGEDGFIFRHYTPEGTKGGRYVRRYFTADNGRKIDAIRARIEKWRGAGWINEQEYFYLLCALIEAVPSFSNISGTYAAFLKDWDARALKPLVLSPPEVIRSKRKHVAANENGVQFAERIKGVTVLYLDPPYNGRQYAPNYHLLETIACNDSPLVRGVSGMRDYAGQKSEFCSRKTALAALTRIVQNADYRHIFMSYNEDGILRGDEILSVLKKSGQTEVVEKDYQRYKSNGGGTGRTRVKEQVYCVKRISPKNRLNDLSGAEWLYFLKSVESTAYSVRGKDGFAHDLRRIHPSPKPPQLMRQFVEFFTKKGQAILDPFMGVGGVLLACSLCSRRAVGVDLSSAYVECYREACRRLNLHEQKTVIGDAAALPALLPKGAVFDMLLTDPPYGDMLAKKRSGQRKKDTGRAEATPFTGSEKDLGNMPRAEFLAALRGVIEAGVEKLKPKGYAVVFAKDMQPSGKAHNMMHCAVTEELLKIPALSFRGYKIWHDMTPKLYPFGYPHAFVANQLHQFALIFRKEE
ncbi:MAG: DNA adenine methylase [Gammaproteobacteria bacterium]